MGRGKAANFKINVNATVVTSLYVIKGRIKERKKADIAYFLQKKCNGTGYFCFCFFVVK